MKTSKILSFAGGLLLLSMFFGSCKDDQQVAPAPNGKTHTIHLDLTANVVKQIDAVGPNQRGFTLDVNHSSNSQDSKTEAIKWGSDTWDNLKHKPQLIGVIKHKSDGQVSKVWKLARSSYEYNPGHGNKLAQVTIYADVTVSGTESEYKVLFYLMDKDQESTLQPTTGSINFTPGAGLYDISGANPVFQKKLEENVFVHPNDRIFFNFIFQGEIDLNTYNSKGVKNFDMKPLGSLLMLDFSPREENDELTNPASVDGFTPSLTTNAFDFSGKIDLTSAKNVNTAATEYTKIIKFEDYDESGTSLEASRSAIKKISKTSLSDIYVKYVLPRDHTGFKLSIANNEVSVYRNSSTTDNFYTLYNTKKAGMNLSMTSGSISASDSYTDEGVVRYNALSYVGAYNVALNKESFNQKHTNADNALVNWEDAKALFSKSFLQGYHLPTIEECYSVVPYNGYVRFVNNDYRNTVTEDNSSKIGKAVLSGVKSAYKTIYEKETSNYVTYAIRYISATMVKDEAGKDPKNPELKRTNCPYLSLWRYSYIDNPNGGGKMMDVYCYVLPKTDRVDFVTDNKFRYLEGSTWTEFTNKKFFEDRKDSGAVHRVFSTPGYGDQASNVGSRGYYWSSTSYSSGAKYFGITNSTLFSSDWNPDSNLYAVRPFVGATQP